MASRSYHPHTLLGNWAEERLEGSYSPNKTVLPSSNANTWQTTHKQMEQQVWSKFAPRASPAPKVTPDMYVTTAKATYVAPSQQQSKPSPHKSPVTENMEEYRNRWTKSGPVTVSRAFVTENKARFSAPPGSAFRLKEILERIRETLMKRQGDMGIANLGRAFRIMDNDGSRRLSGIEFRQGLLERGIPLIDGDYETLLKFFDKNGDGSISFDEFLLGLRGEMSAPRLAVVDRAFAKFDKTGDGKVNLDDLRGVYSARHHPKVISGEMTEDDVLSEFLQTFDGNKDGTVTLDEFREYYAGVSSSVDRDDYFVFMVERAWGLEDTTPIAEEEAAAAQDEVAMEEEHSRALSFRRMLVCYCCGMEFSYASLGIHHKSCPQKREANYRIVPLQYRPADPEPPSCPIPGARGSLDQFQEYNAEASRNYRESMVECDCGRRFEPSPFLKHQPHCNKKNEVSRAIRRFRRLLVCYCCGREYSYSSLPIHHKACPDKRKAIYRNVPAQYKPAEPQPPAAPLPTEDSSQAEYNEYNQEAAAIYRQAMVICDCGRHFEPDPFSKHNRHCRKKAPKARGFNVPQQLVCYSCGEEFSFAALASHQLSCSVKRKSEYRIVPVRYMPVDPQPPSVPMPAADSPPEHYKQYNDEASANYHNSLVVCDCGQHFEPQEFVEHQPHCHGPESSD